MFQIKNHIKESHLSVYGFAHASVLSAFLSLSFSLSLPLFLVTIVTYPIQLSMKTHRSPYQLSFRNNLELKSLTPFVTNLQGEFSIEHQPNHEVYILISHNGYLKTTPLMWLSMIDPIYISGICINKPTNKWVFENLAPGIYINIYLIHLRFQYH